MAPRRIVSFWGRHKLWGALLFITLVIGAGTVVDLVRVARNLQNGREALSGLNLDTLDDGLVPTADAAADQLEHADHIAHHSPFLSIVGSIPGLHSQVEAVRDLSTVGDQLGRSARTAATAIDRELQAAGGDASKRIDLVQTVLDQLDVVGRDIATVDIDEDSKLLPPLRDVRQRVVDELDRAPARLADARTYISGILRLLAGPSRYLVLASNNAEMRGAAGSPLSGGVVTIENGDISFGEFKQLVGVRQPRVAGVEYPADWPTTYRNWAYGSSYLETSVSPNFHTTGPIYEAMAPGAGFGDVDGVIAIDALALGDLLAVIGPVKLDGVTYDDKNVAQEILNENYLRFGSTGADRGERVDAQSDLAKAIFDAFKERDVPVTKLANAIRLAATGRHVIAHSKDPVIEDLWSGIGADGALYPFGLMALAENVSGNKLDWYLQPKVDLTVRRAGTGKSWTGRIKITVTNPEPERTNSQIDGGGAYGLKDGEHRAMVAVYLPEGAFNVRSADGTYSEVGPDPPLYMAAERIVIPRGESRTVTFSFSLPEKQAGAVILPSARVRPVEYVVNGTTVNDAAPVAVYWLDEPEDDSPGAPAVAGILALIGSLALLYSTWSRQRALSSRPLRAIPEVARRTPLLAALLFVAALAVLVAGALISTAAQ